MAINLIPSASTSAPYTGADWNKMGALVSANEVPDNSFLTGWEIATGIPALKQGVYIYHAGATYQVQSSDYTVLGTPVSGINYITVSATAGVMTATWTNVKTGFFYNGTYGGIYDSGDTNQLLQDVVFLDSGDYYRGKSFGQDFASFYLNNGSVYATGGINTFGNDISMGGGDIISDNFDTSTALYAPSNYITDNIIYSSSNAAGLTFDGTNLIALTDTTSTGQVIIHTGISSAITSSFTLPGTVAGGIAFDGTNLLTTISTGGVSKLNIHVGITSTISSSFTITNTTPSIIFDGTNLISYSGGFIKVHSGITSTITASWSAPLGTLAFDGTNIILYVAATGLMYIYDGITSNIIYKRDAFATDVVGSVYINNRMYTQTTSGYDKRGRDMQLL